MDTEFHTRLLIEPIKRGIDIAYCPYRLRYRLIYKNGGLNRTIDRVLFVISAIRRSSRSVRVLAAVVKSDEQIVEQADAVEPTGDERDDRRADDV